MAYLNYENKRGSGKKLKVHFDLPDDEDYPNQKHSGSSFSSDSSIDSDDTDNDNSVHTDSKYGFCESPVWSFQGGSVTQSPPIQHMSSPGHGYDPSRIPSSIFGNKPTSPLEWSVASNESLFSIQLGNSSFSRDSVSGFNNKSGELPRTSDFASMSATLPPVKKVAAKDKNVDMERHSVSSDSSSETAHSVEGHDHEKPSHKTTGSFGEIVDLKKKQTPAEVGTHETLLDKSPDNHSKEAKIHDGEAKHYISASSCSVERDMSARSFQFPILTSEGGRTSSSTIQSEKQEKSENQEEQPEKPQQRPSFTAEKAPKQSGKSWCFCFSCSSCF